MLELVRHLVYGNTHSDTNGGNVNLFSNSESLSAATVVFLFQQFADGKIPEPVQQLTTVFILVLMILKMFDFVKWLLSFGVKKSLPADSAVVGLTPELIALFTDLKATLKSIAEEMVEAGKYRVGMQRDHMEILADTKEILKELRSKN